MENKFISEFRQDLVSGDWVLFATERSNRPNWKKPHDPFYQPKDNCPFEDLAQSGHEDPILTLGNTVVIKNKFPALKSGVCGPVYSNGPFLIADAYGFHELVITRDHEKTFFDFSIEETSEIIKVYKARYQEISKDECGDYIAIIHNFGPSAGGTIYHNHSQIVSTPVIPPGVLKSVHGSEKYHQKNGQKVHEVLIDWEKKEGQRVVYENEKFIVLCPFVSKTSYQVRIYPKFGNPKFESISEEDIPYLSDALNITIRKLGVVLNKPDYNFYIHTAPVAKNPETNYEFYTWHIEIVPRLTIVGGLELGTDVYINIIDPDKAAQELREAKV